MRQFVHAGAAVVAMLAASSASAATTRYDCHQPGKIPTYVDIDTSAQTMLVAEAAGTKGIDFPRQPVCDAFVSIIRAGVGDQTGAYTRAARCTVAFGKTAIVADYISTATPYDFAMTIAFDPSANSLLTLIRIGTKTTLVANLPCTRL